MAKEETQSGFWVWIKNHSGAILIPLFSGLIALVVAYGSFQRDNANLLNRISIIESTQKSHAEELDELDDAIDDLEDLNAKTERELRNLVITEGRELERTLIRLEARVSSIANRLSFIDGIGNAPAYGPSYNFELLEESPDTMEPN